MSEIKTVFISDTHGRHRCLNMKPADLCCFSGDFMTSGYNEMEIRDFISWLNEISHMYKYIIICAGNHDRYTESFNKEIIENLFYQNEGYEKGIRYIQDEEIELDFDERGTLKIYATPYQPYFCNWAWNINDTDKLSYIYENIPENLDILITHCPPNGILDCSHVKTYRNPTGEEHLGSVELMNRINEMSTPPRYHCFGHIHGDGGKILKNEKTTYINASVCDEGYKPNNDIITLEI